MSSISSPGGFPVDYTIGRNCNALPQDGVFEIDSTATNKPLGYHTGVLYQFSFGGNHAQFFVSTLSNACFYRYTNNTTFIRLFDNSAQGGTDLGSFNGTSNLDLSGDFGLSIVTVVPNGNIILNVGTFPSLGGNQHRFRLMVTTSGTTSYSITFGTGFKSQGVLNTGTVSGKVFMLEFVYDYVNTSYDEVSRTIAM